MTFFSGTDIATLKEEGDERAHFVSIIVNNAGVYTARITRKIKEKIHCVETIQESYNTWDSHTVTLDADTNEYDLEDAYLESFNLEVEVEHINTPIDELTLRMNELDVSAKSYVNRGFRIPQNSSKPSNSFQYGDYYSDSWGNDYDRDSQLSLPFKESKEYWDSKDKQTTIKVSTPETKVEATTSSLHGDKNCLSEEEVTKYVSILITGDILAPLKGKSPKNPNYLKNYASNMESYYDKIFKSDEEFHLWADVLVDYVYNSVMMSPGGLLIDNEEEFMLNWPMQISDKLRELAKNKYTDYYTLSLDNYI